MGKHEKVTWQLSNYMSSTHDMVPVSITGGGTEPVRVEHCLDYTSRYNSVQYVSVQLKSSQVTSQMSPVFVNVVNVTHSNEVKHASLLFRFNV